MISLLGLARAFRTIANGDAGSAGDAVYDCMTAHPEMVGGDGRDVTKFMRHVPGLMAKDGADGVFAAALPDGRAVALKIADGANRARPPVMVAALRPSASTRRPSSHWSSNRSWVTATASVRFGRSRRKVAR